jgi:hypothetical protein
MAASVEALRGFRWGSPAWFVALAAIVLAALSFPGELLPDAIEQLRQARSHHYTDWHPPAMAVVWSSLMRATHEPGSLLLLHQLLYGAGFALLADACFRTGRLRQAWALALASCFPVFVFYNRLLLKDVAMASSLLAAAGVLYWYAAQGLRRPWWATVIAAVVLAYGVLVRINAVFAFGPLLLLFFERTSRLKGPALLGFAMAASVVALPVGDVVNHRVLGAQRLDVMQQLQIYDLMGIEARTGDEGVWAPHRVPLADARHCYSPVWWDTFSAWGACVWLRPAMGESGNDNPPEVIEERSRLWRAAILQHPLAYLAHRASHFNSSIYFAVPSFHQRYKHLSDQHVPGEEGPALQRKIVLDYAKVSALVWPVTWLALGVVGLVALRRRDASDVQARYSRALIVSALLFSLGYFVVGIGTDVRYHYWSILAICNGLLLSADSILDACRRPTPGMRLALALPIGVIAIGYATRLLDTPLF